MSEVEKTGDERDALSHAQEGTDSTEKVGPGKPPKQFRFSKENQPTGQQKAEGKARKKMGQHLVLALLARPFKGDEGSDMKQKVAKYFGVKEKDVTVEMMMTARMIQKAVNGEDVYAYNAVMDRAHGKPAQAFEHSGPGGTDLPQPNIIIQPIQMSDIPPIAESEEDVR